MATKAKAKLVKAAQVSGPRSPREARGSLMEAIEFAQMVRAIPSLGVNGPLIGAIHQYSTEKVAEAMGVLAEVANIDVPAEDTESAAG